MSVLIGIAALAAIVGVAILWEKVKSKAYSSTASAVNKRVHAASNAEGADLLSTSMFYAVDAPQAVVLDAIWGGVKAKDKAPTLGMADTYRVGRDEQQLHWRHGALNDLFSAQVVYATANLEDGTERPGVLLTFMDGKVGDGRVMAVGAMKALRSDVLATLRTFDPAVEGAAFQF